MAIRIAGHFQPAFGAILNAVELGAPNAFLEKAKWLTDTNQTYKAIFELQNALEKNGTSLDSIEVSKSIVKSATLFSNADLNSPSFIKAKVIFLKFYRNYKFI